ncbi:MAG: radical SAM protein, partial [Candidatus Heimdallarchaeota archaeon]|nr:radical SAM protein [Candidatus Heimdallarchaeota archaeon]
MMKRKDIAKKPISVNWHFWPWCNMKCKFCFATFNDIKTVLPKNQVLEVPSMLKGAGTEKITFVGGEPMLCPYIGELLVKSNEIDIATKIVSNGTGFTEKFLSKYHSFIDSVSLSIDSSSNEKETILGRGWGKHVDRIIALSDLLRDFQIPLQINTTITSLTWNEDMHELIYRLDPFRWKVFQVLPIKGQNDGLVDEFLISKEEFSFFIEKHEDIDVAIFEDNDLMIGSYIMLDPI